MPEPPSNVYRDQLSALSHGIALWDPRPPKNFYDKVSIGDVGYLLEGAFIRLFNVMLPWDDPSNQTVGKTEPYEPLDCGPFANKLQRKVERLEHYSRSVSADMNSDNAQARKPDDAEGVTYKFRNRGALLFLPNGGHSEEVIRTKVFGDYLRDNIVNWFTWAQKNDLGVERMEDLILVSGCTLVSSWAAATFVDNNMEAEISLATRVFNNGSVIFAWSKNKGPVECRNSDPDGPDQTPILDQCVFIKGFRARRIPFWFRKMAAGAPSLREFEAFIKPGGDTKNSQRMQINRFLNVGKNRDTSRVGLSDVAEGSAEVADPEGIAHDDNPQHIEIEDLDRIYTAVREMRERMNADFEIDSICGDSMRKWSNNLDSQGQGSGLKDLLENATMSSTFGNGD